MCNRSKCLFMCLGYFYPVCYILQNKQVDKFGGQSEETKLLQQVIVSKSRFSGNDFSLCFGGAIHHLPVHYWQRCHVHDPYSVTFSGLEYKP